MHELLAKILETTILLILWYNGGSSTAGVQQQFKPAAPEFYNSFSSKNSTSLASQLSSLIVSFFLNKGKNSTLQVGAAEESQGGLVSENRSAQQRSYYGAPGGALIPAFDPISVLASLAFLAFLLQSFAALFDRTRSMIPTIVSSRQINADYDEQFAEVEKRVMRAIEEYASLSKNLLDDQNKNKKSV